MEKEFEKLIIKMFEVAGIEYPGAEALFKDKEWYSNYTWTEEQQEEYKKWLVEQLKKKGVLDRGIQSKVMREREANWFLLGYGLRVKD